MKKSARSLNEKISLAYLIGAVSILVAFLGSLFFIRWPPSMDAGVCGTRHCLECLVGLSRD